MQCSRYWLKMTTNTVALGALDSEGQRLVREYDLTRPVKFRHVRWLSLYSFIMCCCQGVCLNLIRSCVCSVTGCEGLPSRHLAWCAWSSRRNMLMCVPSFQIETGLVVFPACFIISDVFRRAWELLTSSWLVVVIDLVDFADFVIDWVARYQKRQRMADQDVSEAGRWVRSPENGTHSVRLCQSYDLSPQLGSVENFESKVQSGIGPASGAGGFKWGRTSWAV